MGDESEQRGRCRLIRSEDDQIHRAFRLRRKPFQSDIIFDVADTVHGAVCDCPDFVFRRDRLDPKGCLHIRAMRAVGLLGREQATGDS